MKPKDIKAMARQWLRYTRYLGPRTTLQYLAQRGQRDVLEFRIPSIPTPVYCRSHGPDFFVLYDLLGKKRGDYPFTTPPSLIVDAGAHVGYATLFYANRWPEAQIIALEPEPSNCQLLRLNCARYSNVTILQARCGISGRGCELLIPTRKVGGSESASAMATKQTPNRWKPIRFPTSYTSAVSPEFRC